MTTRSEYHRLYYKQNPERYREANRRSRARRTELLRERKDVPCADCGLRYPSCVMDFDHVTGEKEFDIARGAAERVSMKRLLAEMAKCEVVCSNCHRIRTTSRRQV